MTQPYQLAPSQLSKYFDNSGRPLAGGLVYTYQAGTTNPQASYPSPMSGTPNPNPVTLNARGEAPIYLDPSLAYKINVTDGFGNQIPGWPVDNIPGGPISGTQVLFQTFTTTQGQTAFASSRALALNLCLVILDGAVLIPTVDYTIASNALTLTTGTLGGQTLVIWALA